jgi:cation diffusion facilitator CzcD-associated flavoprotein CzcO
MGSVLDGDNKSSVDVLIIGAGPAGQVLSKSPVV